MHRTRAGLAALALTLVCAAPASAAVTLEVDPTKGLDPAGATVQVNGSGVPLDIGTPMGPMGNAGLYASQLAIVDGAAYYGYAEGAKYIRRTGPTPDQKLNDDGTFSTTVQVAATFAVEGTTIDCQAANTECFVASWPAHGNPTAENVLARVPISFGATEPVSISGAKLTRRGVLTFAVDQPGAGAAVVQHRVVRKGKARWRTVDTLKLDVAEAGRVREKLSLDGKGRFRVKLTFVAEDDSRATAVVGVRR
jgi:hypothetical protein